MLTYIIRCSDQAGDRVLFHELGHVHPDHGLFAVEEKLGQCLGQFGLADPGGAHENERADGPVGVLQARAGPAHGVRHGGDGLFLADDPAP